MRILSQTTSLCAICKKGINAQSVERDGRIYLEKTCPTHGAQNVLIASDANWYHEVMQYPAELKAPPVVRKEVNNGCPFDCGMCGSHTQKSYLPVVPITSACNLNCPICYTHNKNKNPYTMSLNEFSGILNAIKDTDPDLRIINFTGGEPTLHPDFLKMVEMCREAGIHRITVSTHGLVFLKDEQMLRELASLNARIVLSFNSFKEEPWEKMCGLNLLDSKLKVLELLEKHDVDTTLIPVLGKGCNDDELGSLVELLLGKSFLRSLEIHTMTFTGHGGLNFADSARLTTPDVMRAIEVASNGNISLGDFVPSPCAHPLCYQTCYLMEVKPDEYVPFARFMSKENIRKLLHDNLYMEPGENMERVMTDVMMQLWSMDISTELSTQVLKSLKTLLGRLFPEQPISYAAQQKISEQSAKTIYIHSHMDDLTFDTDRVRQCCVTVPDEKGCQIPTCSYNVLYRERDSRFSDVANKKALPNEGGAKW